MQQYASIGITVFLNGMQREGAVSELFKQADMALYQAKAAGRNTLRFFDQEMQSAIMARAILEEDLREACRKKQFILHYQAQVGQNGLLGAGCCCAGLSPARHGVTGTIHSAG